VILSALLSHAAPVSVIARSLCVLFNNVVDRAAFYTIVNSCQDQLRRELVHRLGLLNVWSPLFPGTECFRVFLTLQFPWCDFLTDCVFFLL